MKELGFIDRSGIEVVTGDFIELLKPFGSICPGPYEFCSVIDDRLVLRIAGIEFSLTAVTPTCVQRLNWNRWQRSDYYLDRFLRYYFRQTTANLESSLISG